MIFRLVFFSFHSVVSFRFIYSYIVNSEALLAALVGTQKSSTRAEGVYSGCGCGCVYMRCIYEACVSERAKRGSGRGRRG